MLFCVLLSKFFYQVWAYVDKHFFHYIRTCNFFKFFWKLGAENIPLKSKGIFLPYYINPLSGEFLVWPPIMGVWTFKRVFFGKLSVHQLLLKNYKCSKKCLSIFLSKQLKKITSILWQNKCSSIFAGKLQKSISTIKFL